MTKLQEIGIAGEEPLPFDFAQAGSQPSGRQRYTG
jgi:hypothetical protein